VRYSRAYPPVIQTAFALIISCDEENKASGKAFLFAYRSPTGLLISGKKERLPELYRLGEPVPVRRHPCHSTREKKAPV